MAMPGRIPTAECFRRDRAQKNHTDPRQYARIQNDIDGTKTVIHTAFYQGIGSGIVVAARNNSNEKVSPKEGLAIRKANWTSAKNRK